MIPILEEIFFRFDFGAEQKRSNTVSTKKKVIKVYCQISSRFRRINSTVVGYLGFISVPGFLFPSLQPLTLCGLFFFFWLWPYISMLWTTPTDTPHPTDWIDFGGKSYNTKFMITSILTMFNPFVLFASIKQLLGHIAIFFRYSESIPGIEEHSNNIAYRLPFNGEWIVLNGNVEKEHSHSWFLYTQRYAYDFVITDENGRTIEFLESQMRIITASVNPYMLLQME